MKLKPANLVKIVLAFALSIGFLIAPLAKPALAVNGYPLTPFYQVAGKYVLSTDGLGTTASSGTLQAEKPSSTAVVKKAFLMSSAFGGGANSPSAPTLEGTIVTYSQTVSGQTLSDVTSIVSSKINSAPVGVVDLDITDANTAEGFALAVVFYDPNLSYSASVVLSFGRADTVGSSTEFDFSKNLEKQSYMDVTMSLGISYSYQSASQSDSYSCLSYTNCTQQSRVSLTLDGSNNPIYISATAGGADDAAQSPTNGNLLTVGGVGDRVSKPVDSTSSTTTTTPIDNELYSLIDVLPNGTTGFTLNSVNPSANDFLFFAGFYFKGIVARGTDTSGTSSLPVITDVAPCYGPTAGGTSVTLTGSNLAGATSVKFGANAATISSNTATSLVAVSPAGNTGFVDVEVTTTSGSTIQFDGFQYGDTLTACDGSVAAAVSSSPSNSVNTTPSTPTASSSTTLVEMSNVTFVKGNSKITAKGKKALNSSMVSYKSASSIKIVGGAGYLSGVQKIRVEKLATNRANSIKKYLAANGVDSSKISIEISLFKIGKKPLSKVFLAT